MPLPDSIDINVLKQMVDVELSANAEGLELNLSSAFEIAQAAPPRGCGRLLVPDPPLPGEGDPAPDPVQKRIRARGRRFVRVPDAREITEVLGDGTEIDDYEPIERDGHIVCLELSDRYDVVEVTGEFGFAAIPDDLLEAIYILAARSYYERQAQFADQVALAEGVGVQAYYRQLPQRVKLIFGAYAVPNLGFA